MNVVTCHKTLVESSIKECAMVESRFDGRGRYVSDGLWRPSILKNKFLKSFYQYFRSKTYRMSIKVYDGYLFVICFVQCTKNRQHLQGPYSQTKSNSQ